MSRDHRKLRVFADAHTLTVDIYHHTKDFPKDEWFGLRGQLRRAAVSIGCNLVEGNARRSTADYLRLLHTALGSACELNYLIQLTVDLGLARREAWSRLTDHGDAVARQLERLAGRMEVLLHVEQDRRQ